MKRYTFEIDGVTKFRNVSPENEQKFFDKYGEYNPTLVPEEPGKSQGTSLSQNNQKKDTESNLEDGSLELPNDELGAWQNFKNNLSNSLEMAGDLGEFWGFTQEENTVKEAAESGNLGAYSGLNIASGLIWEGVFGREKMKSWKKKNPNFFETYNPSDGETFQKVIESFEVEKQQMKQTMTFKQANSAADYLSVVSGAVINVGGSVAYNLGTVGTGFFMEFAADNFIEANKTKAKSKNKSLEQLLKDDEAEVATPIKIAGAQAALEYLGFSKLVKPFSKKANKIAGRKLGKILNGNKNARVGLDIFSTGITEMSTEMGQYGLEYYNKELAKAKASGEEINTPLTILDGMFSPEGIESGLQGFFGGGGLRAGGYSAKAITQIRKNNSDADVEGDLSDLVNLRKRYNDSNDADIKSGIEIKIKEVENNIRTKVKRGEDIYNSLSEEGISEIETLGELSDVTAYKINELNTKLNNKEVEAENHAIAIEGLTNEFNETKKRIASAINTKTIKSQIKQFGLDGEVKEMTADEISKMDLGENVDSEKASGNYGFIRQFKDGAFEIIINKDKPAVGTAAHEFLHAILYNTLSGNKETQNVLSEKLKQHVSKLDNVGGAELNQRLSAYENDAALGEETITVMSESILDGSLQFNESFFTSIGDTIRQFLQNVGLKDVKFNTGRDVYNFIKDYNKSIETDTISKAIVKVAKEGAKGKLVSETKTETEIETIKESKSQNPAVDNLNVNPETNEKYTQKEWSKSGADRALTQMEKGNMLDGLIAAKYKVRPIPSDFITKVYSEITNHVRNFKVNENDSLFGWINSYLKFKAGNVYIAETKGAKPKDVKTVDIDAKTTEGAPVVQVEDTSTNMETLTDNINYFQTEVQPQSTESKAEQSKLRVELGIKNIGKSEIFRKVKTALATSKAVDDKGFLKSYEKSLSSLLEPTISKILNDPAKIKKFRRGILEAIPIKTLVQMQKFLPNKIFVKDHGRQTNLTNLSKFVEKGLLPADILNNTPESKKRRAAGVRVYERLNTTTEQFENYIDATIEGKRQKADKSGTRGNNRAKVISEVAKAIGKDATPETLTKDFVQDYLNIKDLKGKITSEKVIEKISEQIDRKPTLKFSKSAEQVESVFIKSLFDIEVNGKDDVLTVHNIDKTFKIKSEEDINVYINNLKTDVLVLGPKEMWFGPRGGTAFTSSSKNIGMSSSNRLWSIFVKKIKALEKDTNIKYGPAIPGVKPSEMWTLRNQYNTLFNSPSTIKSKKKEIQIFNKKVGAIHEALWYRINSSIKKDKNSARTIATYLGVVANDTSHWHKLGAQMEGFSTKITGARYEMEHAMPATNAYLYLLDAALSDVNFDAAYSLIIDNYKLIALDKAMDDKLRNARTESGYSLQRRMPDNWSVIDSNWWERYFNEIVDRQGGIDPASIVMLNGKTLAETLNIRKDGTAATSIVKASKSQIKNNYTVREAHNTVNAYIKNSKARGMSTFDFDETVGVSENFIIAKKDGVTKKIASDQWPFVGDDMIADGWKMDFSDFNKVTKGKPGPLFQKMKNQIAKYGPDNVFILTARGPDSQTAIHEWLKQNGINIPLKNVTGLGQSSGEAKAMWMLDKFAEGYNDMYFVDDALPNVKAVKDVLDQLDIKSKVVQAKIKFSRSLNVEFNQMIERSKGIKAGKVVSAAEAKIRGKKAKVDFFVPPAAEDFRGLIRKIIGRGEQGNTDLAWFKKALFDPFGKSYMQWNQYKQNMVDEYIELKKQFPKTIKSLKKKVPGMVYTNDTAARVYLWDKAGYAIPGLSTKEQSKLVEHVNETAELKAFADGLGVISRVKEGYIKPNEFWTVETIATDLSNTVSKIGRNQFLGEWIQNKNVVFSKENLNKLEAVYGTDYIDALKDVLYRMETGSNRATGKNKQVNRMLDWVNGSVGAIMFLNIRSAALQTISMVNFLDFKNNNIFKASKAFANQPQFWKDFMFLMNSPMLKQRRAGLQIDVSASELTKAYAEGKGKPQAIIAYLLEKGFTPTKIADSFAIAVGGSTFYRNQLNSYLKQGMSEAKAKDQAFLDFQEIAEETQQSSRPDMISMQQAGPLGRLILAFQNTPAQMTRLTKKGVQDLANRRGSAKANVSKILYFGLVQNLIFGALQNALFALAWADDEELEERYKKKEVRIANGALDTLLRGSGLTGAIIATIKNTYMQWRVQRKKPYGRREDYRIMQELMNLSPPMGSKFRKIMSAIKTEQYNKGVGKKLGLRIENPNFHMLANVIEAATNAPIARALRKANNLEEAITGNHTAMQRVFLGMGWDMWSLGVEDEELSEAKTEAKKDRVEEKKKQKEEDKKQKEKENKKKGIKTVRCSGRNSSGKRCGLTTKTKAKSWKCFNHAPFKDGMDRDGDGIKEYRCTSRTKSGGRCKNKTENKNKKCYAHQ